VGRVDARARTAAFSKDATNSQAGFALCSGLIDRCTMGFPTTSGSIDGVGWRFQSFKINDLEMVAQIFPRWNPLTSWMRQIEDFQRAA
jgi:hypothetical protein